jgi:hypothetical protein
LQAELAEEEELAYSEPEDLAESEDTIDDHEIAESVDEGMQEQEAPVEDPLSEPAAEASKDDPDDIMSFFGEFSEASKVPTGLKESIEEVTISDLLD